MHLPWQGMSLAAASVTAFLGLLASTAAGQTSGGTYASRPAVIQSVACLRGCVGGEARVGSVVRARGAGMGDVETVTFLGGRGERDDVKAPVLRAGATTADARVPARAVSGRVRVRNADGAPSAPSAASLTIGEGAAPPDGARTRGSAPDRDTSDRLDARLETRTVFFAGFRPAVIRYVVTAPEPVPVAAEVRRVSDGASVARFDLGTVAPGAEQRVGWDGTIGGTVAPDGRYEFRVFSPAAGALAADATPSGEVAASFRFLDHKFPVRGAHSFGGATALFGAPRQGHTHQGQDVFAACGTPLVAARGGVVVFAAFQGNAGNYVVVKGDGDGIDYAYMHLQQPARVARGARVRTGQRLGEVGDTGNAQGCHLHFEMWSPPGWYEGGTALDPLPALQGWAAGSARY